MSAEQHEPRPESFREGEEAPPPGVRVMAVVRWLLGSDLPMHSPVVRVYRVPPGAPGA